MVKEMTENVEPRALHSHLFQNTTITSVDISSSVAAGFSSRGEGRNAAAVFVPLSFDIDRGSNVIVNNT